MPVIRLPEHVVNRIAAGEVIERPASVVKELVENAIDAGATRIDIVTANGGKTLIRITDNGGGMDREDLALAVERHCTSKLASDLLDIRTLGFRGEALPSIGAVSKLTLTSRDRADPQAGAWSITVSGGRIEGPRPAALSQGSIVEVEDLFFATPARLKFLKTDRAETAAITEVVRRMAIAFPHVRFSLAGSDRLPLEMMPTDLSGRLGQVLGDEFIKSALQIDAAREGVRLTGLASLPAFNRANGLQQYFYVNGRPVRDKLLGGALRAAYTDFLARDRHPVAALFIDIEPHEVDVNVHPAKADVRFRDPGLIRSLLIGSLRQAIGQASSSGSAERGSALTAAFRPGFAMRGTPARAADWRQSPYASAQSGQAPTNGFAEGQAGFEAFAPSGNVSAGFTEQQPAREFPLGAARAQLHRNYIVAQTDAGLVIVDQHAAHERLVYEALKAGMANGLPSQMLLIPEIVELPQEEAERLLEHASEFARLGLVFESFGPDALAVRETPAMLGEIDATSLLRDLADETAEWQGSGGLEARLNGVASRMACHGSVRSGRLLKPDEMNALLRQMENTPNSGVCNHGRPTFIELKLGDIERLFGR